MLLVVSRRVDRICPPREAGRQGTSPNRSVQISPTETSARFGNGRDWHQARELRAVSESARRSGEGMTLRLGGGPEAAAHARAALARLRADLETPLLDTLRLLVTELVSNSVRHAAVTCVGLRALVGEGGVWIEITDE